MTGKFSYSLFSPGQGKLSFTVEEQPKNLTDYIESLPSEVFHASNGWKVAIRVEPEINLKDRTIFLRGSDEDMDDRVHSHWGLGGKKEINKIMNQIDRALEEAFAASKAWKPTKYFELEKVYIVDVNRYDPFEAYRNNPRIVIIDRNC